MTTICGAHSRTTGKACQNIAGKGTDHVGEGRCRYHGGSTPIKHGLYSKIPHARLSRRIAEIANRSDLLQLNGELAMLKALLEQWTEKDQSLADALQSWDRTTRPAFKTLIESNDASEIRQAIVTLRAAEASCPNQLPDVDVVATLIDKIGRTAERIYKMSTVCRRDQIQEVLSRLGAVVAKHVDEETNQKIRDGWSDIQMEGQ